MQRPQGACVGKAQATYPTGLRGRPTAQGHPSRQTVKEATVLGPGSCVRGYLAMATFAEASEHLPLRLGPSTTGGRAALVTCRHWTPVPILSIGEAGRCWWHSQKMPHPSFWPAFTQKMSPRSEDIQMCSTSYPGALEQDPSPEELPKAVGRARRLTQGWEGRCGQLPRARETHILERGHVNVKKAQQCRGKRGAAGAPCQIHQLSSSRQCHGRSRAERS